MNRTHTGHSPKRNAGGAPLLIAEAGTADRGLYVDSTGPVEPPNDV